MSVNVITISGRLTADPQVKFLQNGDAVVSFSIAHNDRRFDRETKQWVDASETLFMDVSAFRQLAEGAGDALTKGQMVTVTGKLRQREYDAKDGTRRTALSILADEIGSSVRGRKAASQPVQEPAW